VDWYADGFVRAAWQQVCMPQSGGGLGRSHDPGDVRGSRGRAVDWHGQRTKPLQGRTFLQLHAARRFIQRRHLEHSGGPPRAFVDGLEQGDLFCRKAAIRRNANGPSLHSGAGELWKIRRHEDRRMRRRFPARRMEEYRRSFLVPHVTRRRGDGSRPRLRRPTRPAHGTAGESSPGDT
jgi:hypothetical protein